MTKKFTKQRVNIYHRLSRQYYCLHGQIQGGGGGSDPPPPPTENHKNIGFLCNNGLDPLKNHKATKPAFNVGPSSARQRNTIKMVFRWRADDGPIKAVFGSFILPSTKKKSTIKLYQIWTPSDKTFWIPAWSRISEVLLLQIYQK